MHALYTTIMYVTLLLPWYIRNSDGTYVTVHAKTSHVRTRIKIHFFTPACSYIH